MTPRRMSLEGRRMLLELEGSRAGVYLDVAGFATTGVGHMLTKDELNSGKIVIDHNSVHYGDLSNEQINQLFLEDLREFERAVDCNVLPIINQQQFDALVSFTFNVGSSAFLQSTLLKKVNAGELVEAPVQFRRWIYAAGKTWDGLVARREREIERWNA